MVIVWRSVQEQAREACVGRGRVEFSGPVGLFDPSASVCSLWWLLFLDPFVAQEPAILLCNVRA
jgi:hypothetical protein